MSITKDSGRQWPLSARVAFTYADLAAGAVTASTIFEAIDLPVDSIITSGQLVVTTAFVGPTVATADVGDTSDPDRYIGTPIDLKTLGRTALVPTGYQNTLGLSLDLDVVMSVAPATAGAAYVEVQYIRVDRANENQL